MKIEFTVNGKATVVEVSPKKRLLDILREELGLIGTKEGCGKGECGACTVILNGRRVNSCLVPALQLSGSNIVTIEGLRKLTVFPAIEQSYLEHGAVQCGFCTTGFVMATAALLAEKKRPIPVEEIKTSLAGNLCRCTGYAAKIIEAVTDLSHQPDTIQQIQEEWQNLFGA